MRQEIIEQEVTALWVRYLVIEKMTSSYSDCIENRVCDPVRRVISVDLEDTQGQSERFIEKEAPPLKPCRPRETWAQPLQDWKRTAKNAGLQQVFGSFETKSPRVGKEGTMKSRKNVTQNQKTSETQRRENNA